jgi:hypothetical protein
MRQTLLSLASETLIISGAAFMVLTLPLVAAYPPLFATAELVATFLLRFTLIGTGFVGLGAAGILPEIVDSLQGSSVFHLEATEPETNRAQNCPNFFLDNPEDLC